MTLTEDGLPVSDVTGMTAALDEVRDLAEASMAKLHTWSGDRWRIAQARNLMNAAIDHLNLLLPQDKDIA